MLYPTQPPPGLARYQESVEHGQCYGKCSMMFSEVQLYYFAHSITPDYPNNQISNFSSTVSGRNLET